VAASGVAFDLQVFAEQRHGGVSRYFRELMGKLAARAAWSPVVTPGFHIAPLPREGIRRVAPVTGLPPLPHSVRALRAANRLALAVRRKAVRREAAVYHPTWYDRATIELLGTMPLVVTIHDLIPERWPDVTTPLQVAERRWVIERAAAILCVSNATRDALADRYPGTETKATVAHLGMSDDLTAPVPSPARAVDPYFVYVGKRGSYKDFPTCLRALAGARADVRMVVAGGGPPEAGALSFVERHRLAGRVRFEPAPDDARMRELLAGSCGLISSSREEGFGLPPLEALALGVPVVLSDIPVYREVYGRWASFFPPGDPQALASLLERTLDAPPLPPVREDLVAAFSWDEAAARAEDAYARASA
jgi:glycosyltransferase involved in cell wall biosynthesis